MGLTTSPSGGAALPTGISGVLGSGLIDLNANGAHVTIYTVPASRRLVVQDFVLRDFSAAPTTCMIDIQLDGASVLSSGSFTPVTYSFDVDLTFQFNQYDWEVTSASFLQVRRPELGAGKIVRTEITNPEGSALTCRLDLIGYLIDSSSFAPV